MQQLTNTAPVKTARKYIRLFLSSPLERSPTVPSSKFVDFYKGSGSRKTQQSRCCPKKRCVDKEVNLPYDDHRTFGSASRSCSLACVGLPLRPIPTGMRC